MNKYDKELKEVRSAVKSAARLAAWSAADSAEWSAAWSAAGSAEWSAARLAAGSAEWSAEWSTAELEYQIDRVLEVLED